MPKAVEGWAGDMEKTPVADLITAKSGFEGADTIRRVGRAGSHKVEAGYAAGGGIVYRRIGG